MGFRLIELGANHDYEKDVWSTIKKIKADFPDVLFTIHCYFPPIFKTPLLCNPAEGLTKDNLAVLSAIKKAAQIVKAKVVSFHPGATSRLSFIGEFNTFKGFKKFQAVEKIPQEKALKGVADFFTNTLKFIGKHYPIAIENSFAIGDKPPIVDFLDFKNFLSCFPHLYFLLDYGHATLLSNNPNQFFSFSERIIEIHLHDVNNDNLDHRVLGTGKVDLESLFFEVKKLKIRPYLILEHSGEPSEEEIIKEKKLVEKYLK